MNLNVIDTIAIFFFFQPTRFIIHLVSKPAQVNTLHLVEELQVGDHQGYCDHSFIHNHRTLLLFYAGIHGQENDGRLRIKPLRIAGHPKNSVWRDSSCVAVILAAIILIRSVNMKI